MFVDGCKFRHAHLLFNSIVSTLQISKVRLRAALASKRKHLETQIRSEIVRVVKLVSRYMLLIDYSTCTHLLFGASNLDSGNGIQWKVAADFGL